MKNRPNDPTNSNPTEKQMNEKNYEIIKKYFGTKFIQYIINYDGELNRWTKIEELELDNNRTKALAYLDDIQKKCL